MSHAINCFYNPREAARVNFFCVARSSITIWPFSNSTLSMRSRSFNPSRWCVQEGWQNTASSSHRSDRRIDCFNVSFGAADSVGDLLHCVFKGLRIECEGRSHFSAEKSFLD
jgi:hypothetical protein